LAKTPFLPFNSFDFGCFLKIFHFFLLNFIEEIVIYLKLVMWLIL